MLVWLGWTWELMSCAFPKGNVSRFVRRLTKRGIVKNYGCQGYSWGHGRYLWCYFVATNFDLKLFYWHSQKQEIIKYCANVTSSFAFHFPLFCESNKTSLTNLAMVTCPSLPYVQVNQGCVSHGLSCSKWAKIVLWKVRAGSPLHLSLVVVMASKLQKDEDR